MTTAQSGFSLITKEKNYMTKQDEICLLTTCAETLGPDSYCGPWLKDQIQFIERDIRSDMFPQMTWAETRKFEQDTINLAKEQAERIVKDAEEQAARIKKDSEKYVEHVKRGLIRDIEKALSLIQ
jgi:hypothetical protein